MRKSNKYQWFKLVRKNNKVDYTKYVGKDLAEALSKLENDLKNESHIWCIYFETGKSYKRKVEDIAMYKPISEKEVEEIKARLVFTK